VVPLEALGQREGPGEVVLGEDRAVRGARGHRTKPTRSTPSAPKGARGGV
jgi:hypothetical protein